MTTTWHSRRSDASLGPLHHHVDGRVNRPRRWAARDAVGARQLELAGREWNPRFGQGRPGQAGEAA